MIRIRFNAPLITSAVAIALALIGVLVQAPALVAALVAPAAGEDPTVAAVVDQVSKSQSHFAAFRQRFDGRSIFFKPDPWPQKAPPPPPPPPPTESVAEAPPPPRVTVYTGPPIIYAMTHEVCFQGAIKLAVGEEKSGIKLISTEGLPWSVRVLYKEWEGDVTVFGKTGLSLFPTEESGQPAAETAAEEKVAADEPSAPETEEPSTQPPPRSRRPRPAARPVAPAPTEPKPVPGKGEPTPPQPEENPEAPPVENPEQPPADGNEEPPAEEPPAEEPAAPEPAEPAPEQAP
jgi:hypothetical protein